MKPLENVRFEVSFEVSAWGNVDELREVTALAERAELTPIEQESPPAGPDQRRLPPRLEQGEIRGRAVVTPN
jgi:hypothetical protein